MQITSDPSGDGIARLRLAGRISRPDASPATGPVEEHLGGDGFGSKAVINLEQADFIDSSGVGWLLECHRKFEGAGGAMVLHSVPPLVGDVLKVLKMDEVFTLADDEKGAVDAARGAGP